MPSLEEKQAWLSRLGVTALPLGEDKRKAAPAGDDAAPGVSGDTEVGGSDGGDDGGTDGGADGGTDGGADGGTDGGADGGTDGGADGGTDGGADGGSDGGGKGAVAGPPVISHQTEAKQPSNRARTKLGVGERVTLSVKPGPGAWSVTKGKLSAKSGATVVFTADSKPGSTTVTVTVGGQSATVDFDVIAPTSVVMSVNGLRHKANNVPNGGIHTDVYIGPADVSFANIELLEQDVGATASGRWAALSGKGHHPNKNWGPMTQDVASGKGTKFAFMDNCAIWGGSKNPPWEGHAAFQIPWLYRVVGDGGGGTKFATVAQTMDTDASGATTVAKGGASHTFALTDGEASYSGAPY